MKQLSILITLLIGLGFSSVCWGEVYNSLKVPNYKNIHLVVEDVEENSVGITRQKIETIAKLRLLRNGIKASPTSTNPYMVIAVMAMDATVNNKVMGTVYNLKIGINKVSLEDRDSYTGALSTKRYLGILTTFDQFREDLDLALDQFILNYLESNME